MFNILLRKWLFYFTHGAILVTNTHLLISVRDMIWQFISIYGNFVTSLNANYVVRILVFVIFCPSQVESL